VIEKPRRVDKPWGYELIWAETDHYVGKILHVYAGEALSLQYHEVKEETLFLLTGRIKVRWGPSADELEVFEMEAGDALHLTPGTVHGIEAMTECDVLEASTPHLDDIVRLQDRYGRVSED